MSPRPGRKPPGTLHSPPGPAIEWCDDMLAELERCATEARTAAETARRIGVDVNALGRGGMLLIWRYKHGRPI
jgi:hypothetical protein